MINDSLQAPPRFKSADKYLSCLAAGLTFLAFLPVLSHGFLNWDDSKNFLTNPFYRGLGGAHLKWMFTTYHMGPYQPLSWMTLGLDYLLWGMNPRGYHLTSVLIHCANAVVFCFVALRLFTVADDVRGATCEENTSRLTPHAPREFSPLTLPLAALFGALFFSLHPLRVESVAWITERRDVLSGFFVLLATLIYLKTGTGGRQPATGKEESNSSPGTPRPAPGARLYWLSVFLFLCSILSKATAISWAWVFLILDVYPLKRLPAPCNRRHRRDSGGPVKCWFGPQYRSVLLEKIPFFLLALAGGVNGIVGLKHGLVPMERMGIWPRIVFLFYSLGIYPIKTFLPFGLSPLHETPAHLSDIAGAASGLTVLILIVGIAAWKLRLRWPAFLASWLAYLAIILPISGVAQNGFQITADRYSYLACMPFAVLFGGIWISLISHFGRSPKATVINRIPCAEGGRSEKSSSPAVSHKEDPANKLGMTLFRKPILCWIPVVWLAALGITTFSYARLWKDDFTLWSYAVRQDPGSGIANTNLAFAYSRNGRDLEAIPFAERAIQRLPGDAKAQDAMGLILAHIGRLDEAVRYYERALQWDPSYAQGHLNMGSVLHLLGHWEEAKTHFRRAIELNPYSAQAYENFGVALAMEGEFSDALNYQEKGLALDATSARSHRNLGLTLAHLGRPTEARAAFERAGRTVGQLWTSAFPAMPNGR